MPPALRRSHSSFLLSLSNDMLTCDCFNFALLFSLAKRFLQAKLLTPMLEASCKALFSDLSSPWSVLPCSEDMYSTFIQALNLQQSLFEIEVDSRCLFSFFCNKQKLYIIEIINIETKAVDGCHEKYYCPFLSKYSSLL